MLIRKLTLSEKKDITIEINENLHLFGNHSSSIDYSKVGALREGSTIWLIDEAEVIYHQDKFQIIRKIMKEISDSYNFPNFGRVYIHRLAPGNAIPLHTDSNRPYYNLINRYHIYLDIPQGLEILHAGYTIEEDSIMLFNHKGFHKYTNKSNQNAFFIVFDLYKAQ